MTKESTFILVGNNCRAIVIETDLTIIKAKELISKESKLLHPDGNDVIFKLGTRGIEFINPKLMTFAEFAKYNMHFLSD